MDSTRSIAAYLCLDHIKSAHTYMVTVNRSLYFNFGEITRHPTLLQVLVPTITQPSVFT